MEISQYIRETALRACRKEQARLIKKRDRQQRNDSIHVHNTQRKILDLDDAINKLSEQYYIVNLKNQPLSQFVVNDLVTRNQLKFRKRDCISFPDKEQADLFLQTILRTCKQRLLARSLTITNTCTW